jgi:glycosyltransferase involved in cell wall biosynthesis
VIGPYDKDTQWIVDELKRLNVTVLGAIEHSKVITHIREHKLLIHPSLYEAWCIAIAEAMSNAVIPVAWNLPALKEVWGESPGVLIEPNDIDDFVESVCTLLLSDEWKTAGIRCYEWIRKRFSWTDTSNKIWNIITDI